jgi:hypothetical protein
MQIVYSSEKVEKADGRIVKNPNHFHEPIKGATKVFLNGNYPRIAKAYEQAGVPVADISEMRALPKQRAEPKPAASGEPAKTGD